jgi:preprotein translocase subunit SecD
MKARTLHFNIILLLLALATGCQTDKSKKELSAIRLHIEVDADGNPNSKPVPIYRAQPVLVNVDPVPFIDERDLTKAAVIDWMDGFAIQLQFNEHGTLLLESITRANPNRRLAVFAHFDEDRWLAAPLLSRPISDGGFSFTPDATRAEAERIVRGLTNVVAEIKKKAKF